LIQLNDDENKFLFDKIKHACFVLVQHVGLAKLL